MTKAETKLCALDAMVDDCKSWCSCWKHIFDIADSALSEAGQSGEGDVKVFMRNLRSLQQQVATGTLDANAQMVVAVTDTKASNSINN